MGKKYLETKQGSLEQSILGLWHEAADKIDGRTKGYKEHRSKLENRRTKKMEASGDKEEYQKFFQAALKKFDAKSPADMDDEKKKKFFDYVDKNWEADHEESVDYSELHNKINIAKTKSVREMWIDALKQVDENAKVKDEASKHMEVPSDAARGRGVPIAKPDRIGYDSKENQQAYNSITHGTPDNQIDTAKHFMKKGLKSKALHKAVADELGVIHWEIHKQLTHDKSKLHPLHMSYEVDDDPVKKKGKTDTDKKPDEIDINPDVQKA